MRILHSSRLIVLLLTTIAAVVDAIPTKLTWINGIAYSLKTAGEESRQISRLFGGKDVIFCYNPTAMAHEEDLIGYLGDLMEAGTQKLGLLTAEVDDLVQQLRQALAAVGERGCVIHIAHSQGALITSLAATKLTPQEMQRMEVIAFGGAAALRKTPETPFRRCINYYSINDPLLFVVPSAAQALRSGFVTDNDEFCFLSPRVGDPLQDHYLLSPTYMQALEWEGIRFQRQYVSSIHRTSRAIALLTRYLLVDVLVARLRALLKMLLRPILFICIQNYEITRHVTDFIVKVLVLCLIRPISLLLAYLLSWCDLAWRKYKGEEKYVPVTKILEQNKEQANV